MKINTNKIFNTIIFILFTIFVCLYFASNNGYYEYQNKEKSELTKTKMKEFEADVRNGNKVYLKDYLTKENKNYENKIKKHGNRLSKVDYSMNRGLEKTFNFFEKVIE